MAGSRQATVAGIEVILVDVPDTLGRKGTGTEVTVQYEGLFSCTEGNFPVLTELVVVWAHVHGGPVVKGNRKALRAEYGDAAAAALIFMLSVRVSVMAVAPRA